MILKDSDRYFTPQAVLDKIAEQWPQGISLDPAWDPECFVKAQVTYDARAGQDGLCLPWTIPNPIPTPGRESWRDFILAPTVFLNPPYSGPGPWLLRAAQHAVASPETEVIALLNSAPGTLAWKSYVWPHAIVCFPPRLRFGRPGGVVTAPNPHDSAVIYYGPHRDRFSEVWGTFGDIVERRQPRVDAAA